MDYSPISKSGVSNFFMCAQRVYLEHCVPDNRAPGSEYTEFGGEVHALNHKMRTKNLSVDEVEKEALFAETGALLTWLDQLNTSEAGINKRAKVDAHEIKISINEHGEDVWEDSEAIARGFLDRLRVVEKRGIIDEYKTGKKHYDNPFERNLYAQLVISRYPELEQVTFRRILPKIQKIYTWDYQFGKKNLTIHYLNRKKTETFDREHLLNQIREIHREIQDCEPQPKLTKYCKRWFGGPCYYYNQCFQGA